MQNYNKCNNIKKEGFTFKIRTQFSFIVDDHTLSRILSSINNHNISITGYLQTKLLLDKCSQKNLDPNCNIVRLVVGSPNSENNSDICEVRDILCLLGVKFQEKPVIQVLGIKVGVPGEINSLFGSLWCKVKVNAIYFGEESRLFIDTSDIDKALLILSKLTVKQCPSCAGQ